MIRPDMARYQQLAEPITGDVDCSAWTGAILAAIDSDGEYTPTGRQVRLASDEPIPQGFPGNPAPPGKDPSPGLNFLQVDAAVYKLTAGTVNLDVRVGRLATTPAEAEKRLRAGQYAGLQVQRSVLVDAGVGVRNRFRGGHAVAVGFDRGLGALVIGDPLIPFWEPVEAAVLWRAAASLKVGGTDAHPTILGRGKANMMFTRDVVSEAPKPVRYSAVFEPGAVWVYTPPQGSALWTRASRQFTKATSARCSEPAPVKVLGKRRKLVRIEAGALAGRYVEPGTTHVRLVAA